VGDDTVETFEELLRALKDGGYRVVAMRDVARYLPPERRRPGSRRTSLRADHSAPLQEVERANEVDLVPAVMGLGAEPVGSTKCAVNVSRLRHGALVAGDREDAVVAPDSTNSARGATSPERSYSSMSWSIPGT
jgi:hypothetical protein